MGVIIRLSRSYYWYLFLSSFDTLEKVMIYRYLTKNYKSISQNIVKNILKFLPSFILKASCVVFGIKYKFTFVYIKLKIFFKYL